MLSRDTHILSNDYGVCYQGVVVLYDTTGYTAVRREVLTNAEMDALVAWYITQRPKTLPPLPQLDRQAKQGG
jgi:hypothetical protein